MTRREASDKMNDPGPNGAVETLTRKVRGEQDFFLTLGIPQLSDHEPIDDLWAVIAVPKLGMEPQEHKDTGLIQSSGCYFIFEGKNSIKGPGLAFQSEHPENGTLWTWASD